MQLYGETAIVTVLAHLKGTFQGTPIDSFYRYLRVWLFQEERWQIVAGNVSVATSV
jgi:ketosteroid isomerase-like protein